jgi:hypothetical protein
MSDKSIRTPLEIFLNNLIKNVMLDVKLAVRNV